MITFRQCLAAASLLIASLAIPASPAVADATPGVCTAPIASTTQPGYLVADPDCDVDGTPFTASPGAHAYTGVMQGAAYRIEVPGNWNGQLVLYAHGYRGTGNVVYVNSPTLRAHYIAEGYAWAASSYATNGYDVGQGVRDSYALISLFTGVTGQPARSVYMTGESMGGQVVAVAIEHYPNAFVAAMPVCGVLGDASLYDYYLDANVTAAAIANVKISFPLQPSADYPDQWRSQVAQILPALGVNVGAPPQLTAAGKTWESVVEQRTGGSRPGFDGGFAYWNTATSLAPLNDMPFLFGLYPGVTGGTGGIAKGNLTSNLFTFYRSSGSPFPSLSDLKLNAKVLRVAPTARPSSGLDGIPRVNGTPTIPVLSMHDVDDLFVPFSMEQIYAQRVAAHGRSNLFVSRAIRGVGHCDFTVPELTQGFDDLTNWVKTGHRPAGDPILDNKAVASPTFGCRFTKGTHPYFVGAACPV